MIASIDSHAIAVRYAKHRSAEMVGMKWVNGSLIPNPDATWQITEGTRQQIRGLVSQAIEEGWGVDKLTDALQTSHAFSSARARVIARTEIGNAYNEGSYRAAQQAGAEEKFWLTANDDKVSDQCVACEDEGWIPFDAPFSSGVQRPKNHPNCRCTLGTRSKDGWTIELDAVDKVAKAYNPDQPRDDNGRFAGGGSVVTLTGKELGEHNSTKDLRKAAMAHASEHLIGKSFTNTDSGHEIKVTSKGIKHTLVGAGDDLVKTISALPSVIKGAKLYQTESDKRGDQNVLAVEKYKAQVNLAGANQTVLMTVKHYKDGRRYYDHGFFAKK